MESCNLGLTKTQKVVARCVALGMTNQEIADLLHRSIETVKDHIKNLADKCNVSNRTALAVYLVLKEEVKVTASELHANALAVFLFFFMGLYIQVIDSGNEARHQPRPTQMSRNVRREQYDV